jgi:hypothetical protein
MKLHARKPGTTGLFSRSLCGKSVISRSAQTAHALVFAQTDDEVDCARCRARMTAQIEELGRSAGRRAASWVFDGNTTERTYAAVLRGIEDGDPVILDRYALRLPAPEGITDESERQAWEEAAQQGYWDAVEDEARRMLA